MPINYDVEYPKLQRKLQAEELGHLKAIETCQFVSGQLESAKAKLKKINATIFAKGAPVGSAEYFKIRELATGGGE